MRIIINQYTDIDIDIYLLLFKKKNNKTRYNLQYTNMYKKKIVSKQFELMEEKNIGTI